jgi:tetratricopeptide (TPR) repeat protein
VDPKYAGAWTNRGGTYNELHECDRALADLNRAIELDPKDALAWNNRGNAYRHLHQYDKAIADYSRAVELDPITPHAWNGLAWQFATCPDPRFRDTGKAVRFAQKAVQLAPDDGSCWNTLGTAHYQAGDWKAAVAAIRTSVEKSKGGSAYEWFILAMAQWKLGERAEARKRYDQAVQWMHRNQPNNEELARFRAEAAELLGIKDKKK